MGNLLLPFAVLLACSTSLLAQSRGSVQISGDTKVSELVEKHIEFNEKVKTVPGYRIQIAKPSGVNSKTQAFAQKQQFLEEYPEMTAYIIFDEPNFKVKVGDFVTRLDAYVFMQKIKNTYTSSTIIKDNVYPIRWNPEDFIPEDDLEQ